MPYVLHCAAKSDVGRIRSKNDDSAYAGRHLVVLADGMGGHVGGDVASASAVLDLAPLDATGYDDPATVLPDEIQNANLVLNELVHANPKLAGMGTTCTAGLLAGDTLYMAHIGDSRAYRLRDGEFEQITRDHTFVQRLVEEGRLSKEEAEHHPNKNVLMRVLGDVDASPELDVFEVPVTVGERWLFCSDGLTDVVTVPTIKQTVEQAETLEDAVDELVDLTLKGGAHDNVTVIVFEVAEGTEEELAPVQSLHLSDEALAAAHPPEVGPVSGRLLREDLQVRPHILVGAASAAVKTDRVPIVTRATTKRRAATLLGEEPAPDNRPRRAAAILTGSSRAEPATSEVPTTAPASAIGSAGEGASAPDGAAAGGAAAVGTPGSASAADTADSPASGSTPSADSADGAAASADARTATQTQDEDLSAEEATRESTYRRGFFVPVFAALLALILAVLLGWGYLWTQTQYYVGEHEGKVAVFKGVSQRLGPLELSQVDRDTDLSVDSLSGYTRTRVESGISARDQEHADQIVADLRRDTGEESDGGEEPSSSPASSSSSDDRSSSPSRSGSASTSPSRSGSASTTAPSRSGSATPSPSGSRSPAPSGSSSSNGGD
ncbi:protein phosphatase 2C domain-containing protein [Micrococcus lylae]|uniref:PP2C family protein-serine/threonine phosphatase n=1 Tax=Micrococcus lylae TaxID=1273 RepID=UPI0021A41E5F|nr:PP2C family serine/threonine-protein phosphatase [Micrococcus lylae]MCT2007617.1 protein phosphatase 2C domain-containing protein [Micrococcus lylae]MCT2071370.1 protein phosphatase 2C domain-containing protein [Micrococcus lylae]